jgi:hypothetical protein
VNRHLAPAAPHLHHRPAARARAVRLTFPGPARHGITGLAPGPMAGPALYAELARRRRRAQIAAWHLIEAPEGRA